MEQALGPEQLAWIIIKSSHWCYEVATVNYMKYLYLEVGNKNLAVLFWFWRMDVS